VPERTIIVDSGPLVAFWVKEEALHGWAEKQFLELPLPFLTCEAVLTETFYLIHSLRGGTRRFFDLLHSGLLSVNFDMVSERLHLDKLIHKYATLPMSLADACLVKMSEQTHGEVFTLDGHFQIYRKNGRHIIPVIMPALA
jgi:predicted nucleic acid-binding protein